MLRVVLGSLIISILILASPGIVVAPEMPTRTEVKAEVKPEPVEVSRGEPAPKIEKRVMRVTAYTNHDKGMNGKGVTTSGEKTIEGRTIAAPDEIPLGSQIYIPALDHTYTAVDRGGAIKGSRLDLYMEKRHDALEFGVQELEVWIRY